MSDAAQHIPLPQDPNDTVVSNVTAADVQVLSSVVQAATQHDPLNPPQAGPSGSGPHAKEKVTASLDAIAQEIPGAQAVEHEKTPEISPELESWMQKVEQHEVHLPQEIVIADDTINNLTGNYAAQPVVMPPATEKTIQRGAKHPVTDSVRWLTAWCIKMIKKFHGSVVYRHTESE